MRKTLKTMFVVAVLVLATAVLSAGAAFANYSGGRTAGDPGGGGAGSGQGSGKAGDKVNCHISWMCTTP